MPNSNARISAHQRIPDHRGKTNYKSPPQGGKKGDNLEAIDQISGQQKKDGVDNPESKPKAEDDKWNRKKQQKRFEENIENAQNDDHHEQGHAVVIVNAARCVGGDYHSQGGKKTVQQMLFQGVSDFLRRILVSKLTVQKAYCLTRCLP